MQQWAENVDENLVFGFWRQVDINVRHRLWRKLHQRTFDDFCNLYESVAKQFEL